MKAVIRGVDDDRIVGLAAGVEGIQNLAQLGIEEANGRIVAMPVVTNFLRREITIFRRLAVSFNFTGIVQRDLRCILRGLRIRGKRNLTTVPDWYSEQHYWHEKA